MNHQDENIASLCLCGHWRYQHNGENGKGACRNSGCECTEATYADAPAATSPPAGESREAPAAIVTNPDATTRILANQPGPMDWPEDYSHENGKYLNSCVTCGCQFTGYKRRVVCKVCAMKAPASPAEAGGALTPDTAAIERAVNTMIHARECFGVVTRLGRCAEGGEQIGNREHCEQMLGELKSATIGLRASLRGGNKLAEHEKAERAGG